VTSGRFGSTLEVLVRMAGPLIRVAAVGDLHCTKNSQGAFLPLFNRVGESADLLLLAGDLTDYGLPEEARVLAREMAGVRIPVVAVLGNHDFESDRQDEIRQILMDAGVSVLDGDAVEIGGIGIAGVKGFGGGFGPRALGPWGEPIIKQFVRVAVDEALKLEAALARLRTERIIALLHYAPVHQTAEGEPPEIFPFIGSGRLEEPINRYPVSMVFHGHAHRGQLDGVTKSNVPVYNVSLPLLARMFPDRLPFRLFEVPSREQPRADSQPAHSLMSGQTPRTETTAAAPDSDPQAQEPTLQFATGARSGRGA
jgi:Icc-related predicted phosphoesterase